MVKSLLLTAFLFFSSAEVQSARREIHKMNWVILFNTQKKVPTQVWSCSH